MMFIKSGNNYSLSGEFYERQSFATVKKKYSAIVLLLAIIGAKFRRPSINLYVLFSIVNTFKAM